MLLLHQYLEILKSSSTFGARISLCLIELQEFSGLRNEEVVKLDKYVGRRVKRKQLAIARSSYTHVTRKNAIYQETCSFCQSLTVHYINSVNNIKLKLGLHELIAT